MSNLDVFLDENLDSEGLFSFDGKTNAQVNKKIADSFREASEDIKSLEDCFKSIALTRFQTGSYVGNASYRVGESNPREISLDFHPSFVIVTASFGTLRGAEDILGGIASFLCPAKYIAVPDSGNYFTVRNGDSSSSRDDGCNIDNQTYHYFAFG